MTAISPVNIIKKQISGQIYTYMYIFSTLLYKYKCFRICIWIFDSKKVQVLAMNFPDSNFGYRFMKILFKEEFLMAS